MSFEFKSWVYNQNKGYLEDTNPRVYKGVPHVQRCLFTIGQKSFDLLERGAPTKYVQPQLSLAYVVFDLYKVGPYNVVKLQCFGDR